MDIVDPPLGGRLFFVMAFPWNSKSPLDVETVSDFHGATFRRETLLRRYGWAPLDDEKLPLYNPRRGGEPFNAVPYRIDSSSDHSSVLFSSWLYSFLDHVNNWRRFFVVSLEADCSLGSSLGFQTDMIFYIRSTNCYIISIQLIPTKI